MITMPGDFMTVFHDRFNLFRVPLGDAAASKKCRFHSGFLENSENPPDARPGPVFRLRPLLVIQLATAIRLHILPALKIKGQHDRHAPTIRPTKLILEVTLLNHFATPFPVTVATVAQSIGLCKCETDMALEEDRWTKERQKQSRRLGTTA